MLLLNRFGRYLSIAFIFFPYFGFSTLLLPQIYSLSGILEHFWVGWPGLPEVVTSGYLYALGNERFNVLALHQEGNLRIEFLETF